MKCRQTAVVLVSLLCWGGFSAGAAGRERDIPLARVPSAVLAAATNAVPGIRLTEAEVQQTDRGLVYEVEGIAGGQKHEIQITADGHVLRVRRDDDEPDRSD